MRKALICLVLIFFAGLVRAQVSPPLAIEKYVEGLYRITPSINIRLFDLAEIAKRKIDTAYIIRHPASWEPGFPNACSYEDTLELYCFDQNGRIIQWTYFQGMGEYSTTFYYDTTGNMLARAMYRRTGENSGTKTYPTTPRDTSSWKEVVKREKLGQDSFITTTVYWKFKTLDTAYVVTKMINSNGLTIELISTSNKRYARENDDTGESTYHYKYEYDNHRRLARFLQYGYKDRPSTYKVFTYASYGQVTETHDAATNKLLETEVQLKSVNDGVVTITTDYNQITLTPIERNSKLYKLKSISTTGEFPYIDYYEIRYQ